MLVYALIRQIITVGMMYIMYPMIYQDKKKLQQLYVDASVYLKLGVSIVKCIWLLMILY